MLALKAITLTYSKAWFTWTIWQGLQPLTLEAFVLLFA